MTTATLHASVQRSRFAHHALSLLTGFFSATATRAADHSAALEAQRVRELAQSYAKTDPGFASDLFAAAARHESLDAE